MDWVEEYVITFVGDSFRVWFKFSYPLAPARLLQPLPLPPFTIRVMSGLGGSTPYCFCKRLFLSLFLNFKFESPAPCSFSTPLQPPIPYPLFSARVTSGLVGRTPHLFLWRFSLSLTQSVISPTSSFIATISSQKTSKFSPLLKSSSQLMENTSDLILNKVCKAKLGTMRATFWIRYLTD